MRCGDTTAAGSAARAAAAGFIGATEAEPTEPGTEAEPTNPGTEVPTPVRAMLLNMPPALLS
ncbi:hypothetical protein KEK_22344 [Mycolicibacterium thermoresistibile ATCC 19527]|uniref:Uncharacterized protein n=1 Tax=Mycolicibacterium thermoresistibile (strain ATCC 19527 / DSM 44167 / CIP 105390 / JCM 6362 / NCTC 10409 / 316) TaxID=1078020 RepID=G7CN71_MYCT3|nr:hypothetical protein KEK_22344 [Mycolicibacterium thermoresistibile ATCC 19527]